MTDLKTLKNLSREGNYWDIECELVPAQNLREEAKKWIKHYEQMHEHARTTGNSNMALCAVMLRKEFLKFFDLENDEAVQIR